MFEAQCLDNSQRRATTLPRVCDIVTKVPKPYWQARGKRLPPTGKPVPFPIPPNWYWSFTQLVLEYHLADTAVPARWFWARYWMSVIVSQRRRFHWAMKVSSLFCLPSLPGNIR